MSSYKKEIEDYIKNKSAYLKILDDSVNDTITYKDEDEVVKDVLRHLKDDYDLLTKKDTGVIPKLKKGFGEEFEELANELFEEREGKWKLKVIRKEMFYIEMEFLFHIAEGLIKKFSLNKKEQDILWKDVNSIVIDSFKTAKIVSKEDDLDLEGIDLGLTVSLEETEKEAKENIKQNVKDIINTETYEEWDDKSLSIGEKLAATLLKVFTSGVVKSILSVALIVRIFRFTLKKFLGGFSKEAKKEKPNFTCSFKIDGKPFDPYYVLDIVLEQDTDSGIVSCFYRIANNIEMDDDSKNGYVKSKDMFQHYAKVGELNTIGIFKSNKPSESGIEKTEPYELYLPSKDEVKLSVRSLEQIYAIDFILKDYHYEKDQEEELRKIARSHIEVIVKEFNSLIDKLYSMCKPLDKVSQEEQTISMEASPKRKKVEKFILDYIGKIVSGDDNVNLYKNLFKSMSDKEFHQFMLDLRDKKKTLSIIVPNGDKKNTVSLEKNLKIAKELGLELFQQLKVTNQKDAPDYITPHKYLILKLPLRRAAQLLSKGISVPDNSKITDRLTGQVTAGSRSGKITYPEIQVLLGLGMKATLRELLKLRGGDLGSANAMNQSLTKIGKVNQGEIDRYSTGVVSTKTLKAYFNAIHVKSTL